MKKLKINVPDGYEIDKEKSTFEEIVFKKKEEVKKGWYINKWSIITEYTINVDKDEYDKNILPTKEVAEQVLALMELLYERNKVWGDWKPDWNDGVFKHCIIKRRGNSLIEVWAETSSPLTFKTRETAQEFLDTHKKLIIKAGDLI